MTRQADSLAAYPELELAYQRSDSDSGMRFGPGELKVQEGQTVGFLMMNAGVLDHQIVFDTKENNLEHEAMVQKAQGGDAEDT